MKPMSMSQKILANKSGKNYVEAGEHIVVDVDFVYAHEPVMKVLLDKFIESFGEGAKVFDPKKIAFFQDHLMPAKSVDAMDMVQLMDQFVRDQEITHYFPYGKNYGVCHIIMMEEALALPGEILVACDSHTVTCGAFNCFASGLGVFDISVAMGSGQAWLTVPDTIRIDLTGQFKTGVGVKDLILNVVGELGLDGARGCTIEWTGDILESMSISDRSTLCNMSVEAGATNSIMELNGVTRDFLKSQGVESYNEFMTDPGYEYAKEMTIQLDHLEPMLALPHRPDNVKSIGQIEKIPIHQVYVGSCTGGKFEDIEEFVLALGDERPADGTRVILVPATMSIYKKMLEKGYISGLLEKGIAVESPGCKACYGVHGGVTGSGENCLATINRNFLGRMGNPKSSVYLSSPFVAAKSAIKGYISPS